MKVWDRYSGAEADLPDIVVPGRFQVLAPCTLNGHALMNKGDILWGDGNVKCALTGDRADRTFAPAANWPAGVSPNALVDEAVGAVTDQLETGELPSPIMPSQLEKHFDLLDFERLLADLLDAGHLQSISQRPRLDMRYDVEVLPVSRARRPAPDALTALASNSQDWSRRRITGIVPARLKALVSEDEHAIYENVVFARLVDRVLTLLRARIHDALQLLEKHQEAKLLSDAQQLDRRLRQDLCTLWGQSFVDNPEAGTRAHETYEALIKLHRKVKQLQHKGLYTQIPRKSNLPIALRNTNILQHDPHYRHLRPIWLLAHAGADREVKTPHQKFEAAKAVGERYVTYVELLVRRALFASELVKWDDVGRKATFGPWELRLAGQMGGCHLELFDGETSVDQLTIVAGWQGRLNWADQRDNYYVFFCHDSEATADGSGDASVLHPLQFYSVERVRLAIEKWLLKQVLSRYPFRVTPLPADLQTAIFAAAGDRAQKAGHGIRFCELLKPDVQFEVEAAVRGSTANELTKKKLLESLKLAHVLGTCRACGHSISPSAFHGSDHGFWANCGECGAHWTLRIPHGTGAKAEYLTGKVSRPFAEVGCRELTVSWSTPLASSNHGKK
ncbi:MULTISPECIES: hypothetical protein [unclassified Variovorax]|uniref:hypothetical protein n=1 Tax=unclassified Variovorax TaxID=663243 RepID=UPI001BD56108|nr:MULTISPECIES: hypothetical protein [unclassified Variovorax]